MLVVFRIPPSRRAFDAIGSARRATRAWSGVSTAFGYDGDTAAWNDGVSRGKIRVAVEKILRKHGYPPDLEAEAVKTAIRQAEAIAQSL